MSLDRDIASGLAERNDAGAALHGSRPTCRSDPNARGRPRAAPLDTKQTNSLGAARSATDP
jgi:hypothetical protein